MLLGVEPGAGQSRAHLVRQVGVVRVEHGDAHLQVVERLALQADLVVLRGHIVVGHETVVRVFSQRIEGPVPGGGNREPNRQNGRGGN